MVKRTIHNLFALQVLRTPEKTAVVFGNSSLSYKELDEKSNQLANYLIQEGVRKEDFVPICIDPSLEMIVSILGVLKAGAVYVPIDPEYPSERISYVINDTKCNTVITNGTNCQLIKALINEAVLITIDSDWHMIQQMETHVPLVDVDANNLAYVIYTSGSTGTPKGVMIEHSNVMSLFCKGSPLFDFNEKDVWTMFHSFCFDFSVWEMYGALLHGGKLVIASKEIAKNANAFVELLFKEKVTILNQTPSAFYILQEYILAQHNDNLALRFIIFGGESLNPLKLKEWKSRFQQCKLINGYGITETTVFTTFIEVTERHCQSSRNLIGWMIPSLYGYVLNESQKKCTVNEEGELYIGGEGLARGYLNLTELTNYRFVKDCFNEEKIVKKLYRSGDIVKLLDDGSYEYVGRIDEQVKINGYRIELGEIENNISQFFGIQQVVVIAKESSFGEKKLVCYFKSNIKVEQQSLVKFLKQRMPDHMVPRIYIKIDYLPLTINGKADKKALYKLKIARPDLDTIYKQPKSVTEINIYNIWNNFLEIDEIGIDDNFFELGGTSLMAQRTVAALKDAYQYHLPITKIYQLPTIAGLAKYLEKNQNQYKEAKPKKELNTNADIAVVGLSGRFPGANTIEELWGILKNGTETVTFFDDEKIDPNVPGELKNDPLYVKARGIIENADMFDPSFFGINTKLAELMDPQQRVFLEIAWETLEKTGHLPNNYKQKIGVFAGFGTNTYYENNVLCHVDKIEAQGKMQVLSVNEKDYAASRTAYHLNLKGPAVSVNSACSTSLLAITQAVNSLRAHQCDIALAGGASITSPINSGHLYQEGSMLSADGHCKPFDDQSTGTVFSDGAGVVLLKRLLDAKQDGDIIFAVIKGVGINNDGFGKGSFTAPSSEGQSDAIGGAIEDAGIEASQITYVEAHGTGTPIGDPIEFEGLVDAFGPQAETQYCAIGSVKSNFGHLTQAAGVAGFIKTCLALYHKKIPASIGHNSPNRNIDFKNSPFYVNTQLSDWDSLEPRFAGVSSFGVGGTNVHVILQSYENPIKVESNNSPFELIRLSANSENSLSKYQHVLASYLQNNTKESLGDVSYTLHTKRKSFKYRKFLVTDATNQLVTMLANEDSSSNAKILTEVPSEIVFSFPGQGSQYVNMGLALYQSEAIYKAAIDQCAIILQNYLDQDIRTIIYADDDLQAASNQLKSTQYTQPALFVTAYALAKLLISWGIEPSLFIGHSVGEYVAAHIAGIFSLEDSLKLVANRGLVISKLENGSMLSVRSSASDIESFLTEELSIAAINSPLLCVVAGPTDQIAGLSKLLDQKEIANKPLFTSHAFHSSMMDPIIENFRSVVESVVLNRPNIKIVSTVTGELLTDEQAIDPDYWTNHLRQTVQFNKAVETVLNYNSPIFIEVGPGTVTSTLIKQISIAKKAKINAVATLDPSKNALASMLNAVGQLWLNGIDINWDSYYTNQNIIELPNYQFDRQRYWLNPIQSNRNLYHAEDSLNSIKKGEQKDQTIMRKENLTKEVKQVLEDASGIEMTGVNTNQNFLEVGFDSLLLTQVATSLKRKFNLPITFRKLNEEYATVNSLVSYLEANLPAEQMPQSSSFSESQKVAIPAPLNVPTGNQTPLLATDNTALGLIAQQLNILTQQLMLLQGQNQTPVYSQVQSLPITIQNASPSIVKLPDEGLSQEEKAEIQKPFGATPKIERQANSITQQQEDFLKSLTVRYNTKTAKSKVYTQESRSFMADPRVVSGFKPLTKELVYPIVINKSSGSKLWDLDGNEYIDALNGFGSNMLGHQPDAIKEALHQQIEKGYEVGPQHELAASVTKLICEFTGFDRSALCSTGSEAVLGCIRIARTVTGRSLIVAFTGSYHGIIDEVLVRGTKKLKSFPAAAGIMPESVQNILVLEYGTPESLAIIKERGDEIAAVLVETIQSRRPEFLPVDFLKELRTITKENGSVLIFDEVITGFRFHPGGAQAIFNIKADLAAYGKVIGAGVPIGAIAGERSLMDALDGGNWQYGDDSFPEIGVTYFAGTFVRHPLALASAYASLVYMKQRGPALQKELNEKGNYISDVLNQAFKKRQLPIYVANYGSMWKVKYHEELPYSELLFVLLREKGIHILDGFPCFMTEATSKTDIEQIIQAFIESMDEMISSGFFPAMDNINQNFDPKAIVINANVPPVKGAKLGKDREGNPAWFIQDPDNNAKYLQIGMN